MNNQQELRLALDITQQHRQLADALRERSVRRYVYVYMYLYVQYQYILSQHPTHWIIHNIYHTLPHPFKNKNTANTPACAGGCFTTGPTRRRSSTSTSPPSRPVIFKNMYIYIYMFIYIYVCVYICVCAAAAAHRTGPTPPSDHLRLHRHHQGNPPRILLVYTCMDIHVHV
jgi:hypothetical protein